MKIILNDQAVAINFGGNPELLPNCIKFSDTLFSYDYNESNASLIDVEPPTPTIPSVWKWENDAWVCIDQPTVDAYLQAEKDQFNESQRKKREAAYTVESDPIYFLSQRGEATQQEWLDKIAEIKARFPYQE